MTKGRWKDRVVAVWLFLGAVEFIGLGCLVAWRGWLAAARSSELFDSVALGVGSVVGAVVLVAGGVLGVWGAVEGWRGWVDQEAHGA